MYVLFHIVQCCMWCVHFYFGSFGFKYRTGSLDRFSLNAGVLVYIMWYVLRTLHELSTLPAVSVSDLHYNTNQTMSCSVNLP